ncbi:MAG: ABC transporter permease, partial [Alphaproteobacteria bacterium]|nr:ABC transporter permease [Alphaproteobacteria bacterium]
MFGYLVHRILIMVPTLLAISAIVFVIIQLPPGDYLTTYVAELRSQGEAVSEAKLAFLREQY